MIRIRVLGFALLFFTVCWPGISLSEVNWEAHIWGGYTYADRETESSDRIDLRSVEMAYWPAERLRLSVMYDNTLTLALPELNARTYSLGAQLSWGGRYMSSVRAGWRELPEEDHPMFNLQQVVFLPGRVNLLRAGGWFSPRADDRNEWLLFGGTGVTVSQRVKVEPTIFYARSGIPGEHEVRGIVYTEYSDPDNWQIGLGTGLGTAETRRLGRTTVWDTYLLASWPFRERQRLRLLLRHSRSDIENLTEIALGFSFGNPP
jgi:hypothetical protein